MTTPAWRSKLQSDTQNVKHVTRLTSILLQRTALHLWLSLMDVWRFGLLRSVLLLPLLILRAIFFPLQWPISMIGCSLASSYRWFSDGPLMSIGRGLRATVTAPVQLVANIVHNIQQWSHETGRRCGRQYEELRELGFLNAMALMPFLIARLIQGTLLALLAAVRGVGRWCRHGLQAGSAYAFAATLWIAGCFSAAGSWRRVKHFANVVRERAVVSPLVRRARSLFSAITLPGGSPSGSQSARTSGWSAMPHSLREHTAWVLVTVTGTLGLVLMLYLQWSSISAATDDERPRKAIVAIPSPATDNRFETAILSPVENDQQEPPVENGFQQFQPDPFAEDVDSSPSDAVQPSVAEPAPDPLPNPFADAPQLGLEMTLGWLESGLSFDQLPGNEFVVSGLSLPEEPLESLPAFGQTDDGWKVFDATISPMPSLPAAAARMQFVVPDLIVPAKVNDAPIDPNDVTQDRKELNVTVSRDIPATAAVGRLTSYHILVINRGRKTVDRVTVEERLPKRFRAVETTPPSVLEDGKLVWQLGALQLGEQRSLRVQVMPTLVGPVENVVTVRPTAAVIAKTLVSEPTLSTLQLGVSAPFQVAFGKQCVVQFKVTNTSAQQFDRVILRVALPAGLSHHKGRRLDYHLDAMQPGETRHAQLTLRSETIGSGTLDVGLVVGEETFGASKVTVEIVQP